MYDDIEDGDASEKEEEINEHEKGIATNQGILNIEHLFKDYILPTLDDLWQKFKFNTKESLSATETGFYTLKNWWISFTNSYVYVLTSNTIYYMGGFVLKNLIYEPIEYFFGGIVSFIPSWFKEVGIKGYDEMSDILTLFRNWVIYPAIEGVIFLDKAVGSFWYIATIPLMLPSSIYHNLQRYMFGDPFPPEWDEEEDDDPGDYIPKNRKKLGWQIAEIAIPAAGTIGVILLGLKLFGII